MTLNIPAPEHDIVVWVDNNEVFQQLSKVWQKSTLLFIDTEFERRTTYYSIFALLQIYDGEKVYLIDPLKVNVNADFQSICSNKNIIKVMHACKEDLEVFYHAWQCQFESLFDTQTAYGFVTKELSKGYANLVVEICDVTLDKQATQSDWLKRPLSQKQLDYAASDVIYLPALYYHLSDLIQQKKYYQYFLAECRENCQQVSTKKVQDDYRYLRDSWKLTVEQLALLKALFLWRQKIAKTENKTPNHIFRNEQLLEIAKNQPKKKSDFHAIKQIHPRSIRIYAQTVIDLIKMFKTNEYEVLPKVINPGDLTTLKPLTTELTDLVKQEAKKLDIAETLLMSKRMIKRLAYNLLVQSSEPGFYQGWRKTILQSVFESVFNRFKP